MKGTDNTALQKEIFIGQWLNSTFLTHSRKVFEKDYKKIFALNYR